MNGVVPIEQMVGDDEEDSRLLREMFERAKNYLSSFSWCKAIADSHFGGGVGMIFAIFLFRIEPSHPEIDPWIWVMVGDTPLAYLPLEDCASPKEAFEMYLCGMHKWVALARQGKEGTAEDGVPPVNVPATSEWAEELAGRLQLLDQLVRPYFEV